MNLGGGKGLPGVVLPGRFIPHKRSLKYPHECGFTHIYASIYIFEHRTSTSNYRERKLLQEKARCARTEGPTNNRQSVKAVRSELAKLKKRTSERPYSDTKPPDSSPEPPGPETSSREAQAAGLPPLPDLTLSPPPPSLLSYRAGVGFERDEDNVPFY